MTDAPTPDVGDPSSATQPAAVCRQGERLQFSGALTRPNCAGLWQQAQRQLDAVTSIDLDAVSALDSAGLALLAEVASRSRAARVTGAPAGLAELRAAYRLDDALDYAS